MYAFQGKGWIAAQACSLHDIFRGPGRWCLKLIPSSYKEIAAKTNNLVIREEVEKLSSSFAQL